VLRDVVAVEETGNEERSAIEGEQIAVVVQLAAGEEALERIVVSAMMGFV
jgi:hypothetical protein